MQECKQEVTTITSPLYKMAENLLRLRSEKQGIRGHSQTSANVPFSCDVVWQTVASVRELYM